jgi:biotin transport system substrate-specific component
MVSAGQLLQGEAMDLRQSFSPTNIALVAVFAGLIAASTIWPGIPLQGGVPISLQTFSVILAGAVLGPWRGAAAVVVYLILGTAGLPIFAQRSGGFAAWVGPTAGFLLGFILAAFVTGWIVRRLHRKQLLSLAGVVGACAVGSLLVLNAIGWTWFAIRIDSGLADTIAIAVPFLPGDIIKLFLAAVVAYAIHRAYPWILADTRRKDAASPAPGPDAEAAPASA